MSNTAMFGAWVYSYNRNGNGKVTKYCIYLEDSCNAKPMKFTDFKDTNWSTPVHIMTRKILC